MIRKAIGHLTKTVLFCLIWILQIIFDMVEIGCGYWINIYSLNPKLFARNLTSWLWYLNHEIYFRVRYLSIRQPRWPLNLDHDIGNCYNLYNIDIWYICTYTLSENIYYLDIFRVLLTKYLWISGLLTNKILLYIQI